MGELPVVAITSGREVRGVASRPEREGRLAVTRREALAKDAVALLDSASPKRFAQPERPLAEWEDLAVAGARATGTLRGAATHAGVPRGDVKLCYANFTHFRARIDDAFEDYAEGLFLKADALARKGDGAMLRFMLQGLMADTFGKKSQQVVVTVEDRKEIERLARAMGVDPDKVIETVFEVVNNGKGQ